MDDINGKGAAPLQMESKSGFGFIKLLLTITIAGMVGILSVAGMYDVPPPYRVQIFAGTLVMLLLLSAGRVGKFSKERLVMVGLWLGFGSISLVASLNNNEDLLSALWLFIGVPYLAFCVFPQAAGKQGKIMVVGAIVLAFLPYVVVSLIQYPLVSPYLGVFTNSNLFGMMAVTLSSALFALLRGAIFPAHKNVFHWIWIAILGVAVVAVFLLIVKSRSRTSLIAYAVSCLIFFWSLWFDMRKNRLWIALSVLMIIGTASYFTFSILTGDVQSRYFQGIVAKMEAKIDAQDPLAGRFEIWKTVLQDIRPFGYGAINFPSHYGANAHNTYIMALGALGPAAMVFLIAIHGMAVFLSFTMVLKNIRRDGYALAPFLIIMNYITLGFAELVFGILGNGIHMSFLLMLGVLVNENISGESELRFAGVKGLEVAMPPIRLESERR